jgi:hypothetical protein
VLVELVVEETDLAAAELVLGVEEGLAVVAQEALAALAKQTLVAEAVALRQQVVSVELAAQESLLSATDWTHYRR